MSHLTPEPAPKAAPMLPSAERLNLALDLFDAGVDLQRQRLRRAHPDESAAEIEARVRSWLLLEGEPGDADGVVVSWPRPLR